MSLFTCCLWWELYRSSALMVLNREGVAFSQMLLAWLAVSFLAQVNVWIKTNVERISRVDLGSTPCAATWFLFVINAWIIAKGLHQRASKYKPSNRIQLQVWILGFTDLSSGMTDSRLRLTRTGVERTTSPWPCGFSVTRTELSDNNL